MHTRHHTLTVPGTPGGSHFKTKVTTCPGTRSTAGRGTSTPRTPSTTMSPSSQVRALPPAAGSGLVMACGTREPSAHRIVWHPRASVLPLLEHGHRSWITITVSSLGLQQLLREFVRETKAPAVPNTARWFCFYTSECWWTGGAVTRRDVVAVAARAPEVDHGRRRDHHAPHQRRVAPRRGERLRGWAQAPTLCPRVLWHP